MTTSPLTDQVRTSKQSSSRSGAGIDTFLIHHQAGTNDDAVIRAMVSGTREVSANYTISNEGRVTSVVPEQLRAWTSGSTSDGGKGAAWDKRSVTVEIENQTGAPDWKISQEAIDKAAFLLCDLRYRYTIKHVLGHRDLWLKYKASYATYCPGPDTVQRIVTRAAELEYGWGLTRAAQKAAQAALTRAGLYAGDVDGKFGPASVSAFQTYLKQGKFLPAWYDVDGVAGRAFGTAVQQLAAKHGYDGPVDGFPAGKTSAAIVRWAATVAPADVGDPTPIEPPEPVEPEEPPVEEPPEPDLEPDEPETEEPPEQEEPPTKPSSVAVIIGFVSAGLVGIVTLAAAIYAAITGN